MNSFTSLKSCPQGIRVQAAGRVLFLVNLPVLMYAIFILVVGMVNGKLLSVTLLVLLTLSIQIIGIVLMCRWLLMVPFERKYSIVVIRDQPSVSPKTLVGLYRVAHPQGTCLFIAHQGCFNRSS